MTDHPVWILIADGQHARVVERLARGDGWTEPPGLTWRRGPPARAGLAGRVFDSLGNNRHALEPRTNSKDKALLEFARVLAEDLEREAVKGRFARLFLIAPPRFLGRLRPELGPQARGLLRGAIDKDLARMLIGEVVEHLHKHRAAADA